MKTKPRENPLSTQLSDMIWSQCVYCRHLTAGRKCAAFPDGIPDEIEYNWVDHREPYPGDHGIRFEPLEGWEDIVIKPVRPRPEALPPDQAV
jgi:hypothetical protein